MRCSLPVVFSQIITVNDGEAFLKSRQRRPTGRREDARSHFELKLENEMGGTVMATTETVGWFASQEALEGHIGAKLFEALSTPVLVTEATYQINYQTAFGFRPQFLASIATFNGADNSALRLVTNPNRNRVQLMIEEDTCANADQAHPMQESVSFWAMAEHGIVQATSLRPPSCEGVWDAATAVLIGATVDHLHSGHYGQGFVDFVNPSGDSITWTVPASRRRCCD